MKLRVLSAACATAAALVSFASVAAAPGGTVGSAPKAVGPIASAPAPHVVNLRGAFESAVRHATVGRIGGVVPPTNDRLRTAGAGAATSCKEPDCDLNYNGGPVQHSPRVYLLLWGPSWTTSSTAYDVVRD